MKGGREQPNFSPTAGNRPIFGHTVHNPASLSPPGKHPLSWFLDILLTMSVQNLEGLTESEADTEILAWNSHRCSDLREQFSLTPAEEGHKSKLAVFRWLMIYSTWEFYHDCSSESRFLREAQYYEWPLGVAASPITSCVESMRDKHVDGLLPASI